MPSWSWSSCASPTTPRAPRWRQSSTCSPASNGDCPMSGTSPEGKHPDMSELPRHSVSVTGIVLRDDGRVLAIQRRDDGRWVPPGGVLELDESPTDGVAREVLEETGIKVRAERLTGVLVHRRASAARQGADPPGACTAHQACSSSPTSTLLTTWKPSSSDGRTERTTSSLTTRCP